MATTIATQSSRSPQQLISTVFTNDHPELAKSLFQVFTEFLKTKDLPKLINYLTQWLGRAMPICPQLKGVGVFAGNVKNFMSASESVNKFNEVARAVHGFKEKYQNAHSSNDDMAFSARNIVRQVSDFINSICDGIKLGNYFKPFKYMKRVDLLSSGSTFLGSVNNLVDDVEKIRKKATTVPEKILHGLSVGMDVSYIFVGLFGLMAFVTGVASSYLLVSLSTALIFSISSLFYKNIRDPENKNPDPNKVLAALRQKPMPIRAQDLLLRV